MLDPGNIFNNSLGWRRLSFSDKGPPGNGRFCAKAVCLLVFNAAWRYRSSDNSSDTAPVGSTSSAKTWLSVKCST